MANISETELQRRLRALEKTSGSGGGAYVRNIDPTGTGFKAGDSWYNASTNNLWLFDGVEWNLSFDKLFIRYADQVNNINESGKVSSQQDVIGFSELPFTQDSIQKNWRGLFFGPAEGSSDPTDYEWTLTAGESGETPSFERYYTTTAGLLSEIGDPTNPGTNVTWTLVSGAAPDTAYWVAERYTLEGITSDWQIYPVQAKDSGIPFVKFTKNANAPELGSAQWIADAILAVEAFTGRDYSSQKEFGYGTVVVIDYNDITLSGKYTRSGSSDVWVPPGQFIQGDLFVDGTIAGEKIQANTINGDRLIANTVEAGKLTVQTNTTGERLEIFTETTFKGIKLFNSSGNLVVKIGIE